MATSQVSATLPKGLRKILTNACAKLGCSQGEVVRIALFNYFKELSLLGKEIKGDLDHEKVD